MGVFDAHGQGGGCCLLLPAGGVPQFALAPARWGWMACHSSPPRLAPARWGGGWLGVTCMGNEFLLTQWAAAATYLIID